MTSQFEPYSIRKDLRDIIVWKNNTGETIPAFAIVQMGEFFPDDNYFAAEKPTWEGVLFYVNGPIPIPDGKYGSSYTWFRPQLGLTSVADPLDPADMIGREVGPIEGQWFLSFASAGFLLLSNLDITTHVNTAVVTPSLSREVVCVLDEDMDAATNCFEGTAEKDATVCHWIESASPARYKELLATGSYRLAGDVTQVKVWNHSESTDHAEDTFGMARWKRHWWFFGDCDVTTNREAPPE